MRRGGMFEPHHQAPVTLERDRGRGIALLVLCVGALMIVLDSTIVTVALASIQVDLGFSQSGLTRVFNAYLLAFSALLLLAERLSDLISRKRVFLVGLSVFSASSLLCGLASSPHILIGARFLQGIGAALTSAGMLATIVTRFPQPKEQAKAISIYAILLSGGASIGLLAGGALTAAVNWHWIVCANVPIGVATTLAGVRLLGRDGGSGLAHSTDVPGAVLIVSALVLAVYAVVGSAEYGFGSPRTLGLASIAVGLFLLFVDRELHTPNPLGHCASSDRESSQAPA
jgi:MFS family permease